MKNKEIKTNYFKVEELKVPGENEKIIVGGRDKTSTAIEVFTKTNIKKIGVIGWGSQGPAQAQNLKDSLKNTDIKIKIGLRKGSSSEKEVEKVGLEFGEMYEVIRESDLVILLISDAAQAKNYKEIFNNLKSGATLGLSHGFLLGYLQSINEKFPENINVVGVCPKGMGPSVRRLYEQGKEINGAGINCSFAVEQDIDNNATDIALAWAVSIGAPYIFKTTLEDEYKSDIFGERAILLGGVHGIVEALYQNKVNFDNSKEKSFEKVVFNITGPISKKISTNGIKSIFEEFIEKGGKDKILFEKYLVASYKETFPLVEEIYDEVSSGNEIKSVILAGNRKQMFVPEKINKTPMWRVGDEIREDLKKKTDEIEIDPVTAGIYIGTMMAQIELLKIKGHSWSEISNESIIEAVDSLNPYMHARGVDYMVDNCSRTARLGSRKWAPRFRTSIEVALYDDKYNSIDNELVEKLKNHDIHEALKSCAELRPPVDIFVE